MSKLGKEARIALISKTFKHRSDLEYDILGNFIPTPKTCPFDGIFEDIVHLALYTEISGKGNEI